MVSMGYYLSLVYMVSMGRLLPELGVYGLYGLLLPELGVYGLYGLLLPELGVYGLYG